MAPSSNQKGVGRGAHAAFRLYGQERIGWVVRLMRLRAAPNCWCIISSLARGLSDGRGVELPLHLLTTCRELAESIHHDHGDMERSLPHRPAVSTLLVGSKGGGPFARGHPIWHRHHHNTTSTPKARQGPHPAD